MYFFPMIPSSHRCLFAADREAMDATLRKKILRQVFTVKCSNKIFQRFYKSAFNSKFLAKLCSSWKNYKNPTFCKYTLHNLHGQVLQTHCLTLLLNWSKELSCLMCSGRRDHNCGDL